MRLRSDDRCRERLSFDCLQCLEVEEAAHLQNMDASLDTTSTRIEAKETAIALR